MDVIYWLIPSMIFVGVVLVVLLMMSVKNGQFDDLEGEGQRILFDEEQTNLELKKNMKNKVNKKRKKNG
ncbi:cbb3-type cytochrome oxidase maturation protein [Isorropodon fossajaponicum endosymbiont JTNG4]|uniref:cbb3-type cytochrome oxidase assembly protein CcoS n=1 Tax=Isorropodon fossajaponicum symbiont TaxID=883811 RepID=UPI0019163C4A|nr:cbb3-type cytochrome oxidase assembly protein CcoS [Isorropodon fossajaponicum symbiont]BBB24362.1 cbb3-type cytochrome oxidase maturation protein [Isorropodon fossajaponicum endosymbiont JTNG4]